MDVQFSENKLIELYIALDDLVLNYKNYIQARGLAARKKPNRVPALNGSEVGTILVAYHYSGYKNFEYYYKQLILNRFNDCFPEAPSYECFLSYIPKATDMMTLWLLYTCMGSLRTGLYFVDSKKLEVCHIRREKSNKVFQEYAAKGKSSMGWFYGLKLHTVVNNLGQIISFKFTPGNVADNNHELLMELFKDLEGYCVGDKGYLSKLFGFFYEKKLHLITRPRKNMKHLPVLPIHNQLVDKRGLIESVYDILTSVCDLEHSRHRKPENAYNHMIAALIAYQYLAKKPQVFFPSFQKQHIPNAA